MSTAFEDYGRLLQKRRWSIKYWDGRPTNFLDELEYENLVIGALDDQDLPLLTTILDEVEVELVPEVADIIFEKYNMTLMEWYFRTPYPPLMRTMTVSRLEPLLEDEMVRIALAPNKDLIQALYRWYLADGYGTRAARRLRELFPEAIIDTTGASAMFPTLQYTIKYWQAYKKTIFTEEFSKLAAQEDDDE